ncbi:MAG: hypothetical protein HY918_02135 [Candidatus Doudnabacteria bacterium]|nr:hypothetical protein [Candidatus Doudnabacteria bacterium]
MADTSTQNDTQEEELSPQAGKREDSDTIAIREPFNLGGQDRIVYDISVDKGPKLTFGWKIKPGSVVEISGSGLDIYDQIILWIAGSREEYREIDRSKDGRTISFKVRDNISELYAEGAAAELEFVNSGNAQQNRYLKQQFRIAQETEEQKKQRKVQEESDRIKNAAGIAAEQALNSTLAAAGSVPVSAGANAVASSAAPERARQINEELDDDGENTSDVVTDGSEQEVSGTGVAGIKTQETITQTATGETDNVVSGSINQTVNTEVRSAGQTETNVSGSVESQSQSQNTSRAQINSNVSSSTTTQTQASANVSSSGKVESQTSSGGSRETKISGNVSGGVSGSGKQTVSAKASTNRQVNAQTSATVSGQGGSKGQAGLQTESEVSNEVNAKATQNQSVQNQEQIQEKTKTEAETSAKSEASSGQNQSQPETPQAQKPETGQEKTAKDTQPEQPQQAAPAQAKPTKTQAPGKGNIDGASPKPLDKTAKKSVEPKTGTEQQEQAPVKPPKGLEGVLSKFGANSAALDSKIGFRPTSLDLKNNEKQNSSAKLGGGRTGGRAEDQDTKEKDDNQKEPEVQQGAGAAPLKQPLGDMPQGDQKSEVGDQAGVPPARQPNQVPEEEQPKQDKDSEKEPQEEVEQPKQADDNLPNADQGVRSFSIAEAEKWLNTTVNVYLQTLATMVWAGALPTLGLMILIGAIGGDLIWLLKDRVVKEALKRTPLPKRFGNIKPEDLKININFAIKAQIVLWNLIVALILCFIFVFVFTIFWSICNSPIYYPIRQTSLKSACEYLDSTKLSSSLSNFQSTGSFVASNNTPGSLISTASWTDQINSTAQKWNIDACILRVVIQKESTGKADVIGCDCAADKHPEYCPDKRKTYSSDYQFNWAQCSYGIGLTQWTIYPKGGSGYKAWQDASTPSRQLYSSWYGISDFLNPTTSLDLTAKAFSANLARANGDVASAFAAYVGASNVQAQLVADRMALYNLCKSSATP